MPVLLAACGGDPNLLGKMCQTLTARVPEHLAALRDALRDQEAPRLREAAHKCCGMVSEFSTVAGDLAGSLEELAAGTQLDKAASILEQLAPGLFHTSLRSTSTPYRRSVGKGESNGICPRSKHILLPLAEIC